jgi:hypothetical protein
VISRPRLRLPGRTGLAALAAATLALALVVLVVPGVLSGVGAAAAARTLLTLGALLVGALGLVSLLRLSPSDGEAAATAVDDAASAVHADRTDPLGHEVDEALTGYADADGFERRRSAALVDRRLTEATVYVLVEREGLTEAEARSRVARGTWTDDPLAAAFLADEGEVALPLSTRLREWLRGDRFPRHARAVVDELRDRSERDRPDDDDAGRRSNRGGERTTRARVRPEGGAP